MFALNPQVHAFDDATLVENVGSLRALADTLRGFAGGAALAISPVTLRARVDPRPRSSRDPSGPPFTDDPRQAAPFAAAWTLAFLAAAAEAGFASLTFFELLGPRGVMDEEKAFPVLHALADVAAVTDAFGSARPRRARGSGAGRGGRGRDRAGSTRGRADRRRAGRGLRPGPLHSPSGSASCTSRYTSRAGRPVRRAASLTASRRVRPAAASAR